MNSRDYWERRAAQDMYDRMGTAEETAAEMNKAIQQTSAYLEKEVKAVMRGMQSFGISEVEAKKILNAAGGDGSALQRLRKAAQQVGDDDGGLAQGLAGGIHDVPLALNVGLVCHESGHGDLPPIYIMCALLFHAPLLQSGQRKRAQRAGLFIPQRRRVVNTDLIYSMNILCFLLFSQLYSRFLKSQFTFSGGMTVQHILGLVRRCVEDYNMIEAGETVAVGVSGGKDSLLTLTALARLRAFYPKPFRVEAITLETGMPGMDFSPVADYCAQLDVPYTRISVPVYDIVFNERKEKNPCSLCAKLRRGSLHTALTERGIHKIALGHHYDDAVETLLMNLLFEGRIGCFQPVTYLDRTDITQIRPLLYCQESDIRRMAAKLALPVVKNTCPMDGHSRRQEVKELLAELEQRYPDLRKKLFGAVQRYPLYGWDLEKMEK